MFSQFATNISSARPAQKPKQPQPAQKPKPPQPSQKPKPSSEVTVTVNEDGWTDLGTYSFAIESEVYKIFPKNPETGKTTVIWIRRAFLMLRHNSSQEMITYKYYKHRRNYYWRRLGKERSAKELEQKLVATYVDRKSQPRPEIQAQVARMVFGGDLAAADRLMTAVEVRI